MNVREIIDRLGGPTEAARRLRLKRPAVSMWLVAGRVPLQHVPAVAHELRLAPEVIWPALASASEQEAA